ncbi:hypothetical protein [Aureivirga sp. CE67]|uniref:hypothetical protein n=1 Tax=Aureivirga sp. CE67 TaxID=1788983 RepID=UPI0018C8F46D|nr:hypothetical protein [Aureivirga sp. CE67]
MNKKENKSNIDFKILNQLLNGKTNDGRVGAKVKPTSENSNNIAWISIIMNKGADCRGNVPKYYFIDYEIQYTELNNSFDVEEYEIYDMDWRDYLLKTETYYNITNEVELENKIKIWLDDLEQLRPMSHESIFFR